MAHHCDHVAHQTVAKSQNSYEHKSLYASLNSMWYSKKKKEWQITGSELGRQKIFLWSKIEDLL
jgi:hypothetical protein